MENKEAKKEGQELISRRDFMSRCAKLGAASVVASSTIGAIGSLTSCSGEGGGSGSTPKYVPIVSGSEYYVPDLPDKAMDGAPLKVGIIGCGGRGSGAMRNLFEAANGITIVAIADIFPDRVETAQKIIEGLQGQRVDSKNIFYGFEAYKTLCEMPEIDLVIVSSPSAFHATQAKYAVEKGKHVFSEKPAGIDPVACRTMEAAVMIAKTKGLCIQSGVQRHYDRAYIEGYKRIRNGEIGDIVSAVVKWNQGPMFFAERKPEWTDMEYMLRDFFSWNWLCGDHIIDQAIHQYDVFHWMTGLKPVSVVAVGSQLQRTTGDIFDNFGCDVVYENNVRVNVQARQIAECANDVGETIYGTLGSWNSYEQAIRDRKGNVVWKYSRDVEGAPYKQFNAYVLEHVDLVNHIRAGKSLTSSMEALIVSSYASAMSRESAYTGKEYKYDEFMRSNHTLMPEKLHLGNIPNFEKIYVAPKMGRSYNTIAEYRADVQAAKEAAAAAKK